MNVTDCAPRDGTNVTKSGPDPWSVVISVSFSSLVVFIIAANSTTIASMLRSMYSSKTTGRISRDKVLIVSMSVGDLFLGAFPTSLVVYEAMSGGIWLLGSTVCATRYLSDLCLCTVSIYHVMFMAVDRYLAVCKPLLHRTLPKRTEYIMVLVSWVAPTALVFLPILGHSYVFGGQYMAECPHASKACFVKFNRVYLIIFIITSILTPLLIVFIIYCFILRAIGQFYKRKAQLRVHTKPRMWRQRGFITPSTQHNGSNCARNARAQSAHSVNERVEVTAAGQNGIIEADIVYPNFSSMTIEQVCLGTCLHCPTECRRKLGNQSVMLDRHNADCQLNTESRCTLDAGKQDNRQAHTRFPSGASSSPFHLSSISLSLSPSSSSSSSMLTSSYTLPGSKNSVLKGHAQHTEHREVNDQVVSSRKSAQPTKQNLKAVRTIGLIVVCFVVCWFPTAVQLTLDVASILSLPQWLRQVFTWLAYSNSALNSALYCANTSMRQRMRQFLCSSICVKRAR